MYILPVWVDQLAIIAPFVTSVLFAVLYTLKAPWWRSWMGQNLFFFDVVVGLALLPGFLHIVAHVNNETKFFQWLIAGDLLFVSLVIVQRIYLLFRVQKGWNWVRAVREDVPLPDVPNGVMK